MSELFDVFDDEGLHDADTRAFLVEALQNADEEEWRDILEPFVNPERAIDVLKSVPAVLDRSLKALEAAKEPPEKGKKPSFTSQAFLDSLPAGVLKHSGLHTIGSCACVSRGCRDFASEEKLWMGRTEAMRSDWSFPPVSLANGEIWRGRFFVELRPRCDGIYVAECRFKRYVRIGHSCDLRRTNEEYKETKGRGNKEEWISYRRYVRFLPPDKLDGSMWALILKDSCTRRLAEDVLVIGVDPKTHVNPAKSNGEVSENYSFDDPERLVSRICVGRYTFSQKDGLIEIRYRAIEGEYHMSFQLSHGGLHHFADRLEWLRYQMHSDEQEEIEFNLGKLPDWKGGGLADPDKDHYPFLDFSRSSALEHLL